MSNEVARGDLQHAVPGPYVLRSLLADIQLSEDGTNNDVHITCAEFWNDNLYIGTSNGEIIHYVLLPPEPGDSEPTFIQGIKFSLRDDDTVEAGGVSQILVLPSAGRTCILSDGTLTIYTLPELSPAYGGTVKIPKVSWVGGVDLDSDPNDDDGPTSNIITICVRNKIRLIRIGEKPEKVADVELGGCLDTCRRGNIACVANAKSYSLLDVVEKQSIHLTEISYQQDTNAEQSSAEQSPSPQPTSIEPVSAEASDVVPSDSATKAVPQKPTSHSRTDSASGPPRSSSLSIPGQKRGHARNQSTASVLSMNLNNTKLRPHIVSPTDSEFLLTTGTSVDEPGIGSFVNLDGDTVRGTLEFSRYPRSLVVDGADMSSFEPKNSDPMVDDGYVLAVIPPQLDQEDDCFVEIQRWYLDPSDPGNRKFPLHLPRGEQPHMHLGLRKSSSIQSVTLPQITNCLRLRRTDLMVVSTESSLSKEDQAREKSEAEFVNRLAIVNGTVLMWSLSSVWWAVRTPLVLRLEALLNAATDDSNDATVSFINREAVERTFNDLRGREPYSELDFIGHRYIRQKASLLLFMDLIDQCLDGMVISESAYKTTEETLVEGEVDPRLILVAIPVLRQEVKQTSGGTWVQGGLKAIVDTFLRRRDLPKEMNASSTFLRPLLDLVKRYLFFWRQRKGFGSISDEKEVFLSVDAALLHLLLLIDKLSPRGPAMKGSIREELNGVVDAGVDCFDHAVELLEKHQRLFLLSRLYQSRRQSAKVLSTWRRIIQGEPDDGGELLNGEEAVINYLANIRDAHLVEEYGAWLANRNPTLGVRIFAETKAKVRYEPKDAVRILQNKAPDAVRFYLEHLVFDKNLDHYVNDLVNYYLDLVIQQLKSGDKAKTALHKSYEAYRRLSSPKPSYNQFATENGIDAEWWRARLRLLQLLGGSDDASSRMDVDSILARMQPYTAELVPELIILWGGKQGRHQDALRLLVHELGDFDTAITYCFLGGSSTYSSSLGPRMVENLPSHEEQASLFRFLLSEFMSLKDPELAMEQSAVLLDRFSGWFDLVEVLNIVPDTWSVELISGFLERSLRLLVSQRHESSIIMALASSQNLDTASQLIEKIDSMGPKIDGGSETNNTT